MSHKEHGRVMLCCVIARHAFWSNDDEVVIEQSVARGGLDTSLSGEARHHDRLDAIATQDLIEVGAPESTRAGLAHHDFAGLGVESVNELMSPRPFHRVAKWRTIVAKIAMHSHVESDLSRRITPSMSERRHLNVHNQNACTTGRFQQRRKVLA